ncbi:hypothetical protein SK128_027236 [Halocaridina rubra]|uniref:Single domain-containing protein n=1 Tax=Halocaridina rubra TaxID=373956 RepID=A0AAN8X7W4_HALRR
MLKWCKTLIVSLCIIQLNNFGIRASAVSWPDMIRSDTRHDPSFKSLVASHSGRFSSSPREIAGSPFPVHSTPISRLASQEHFSLASFEDFPSSSLFHQQFYSESSLSGLHTSFSKHRTSHELHDKASTLLNKKGSVSAQTKVFQDGPGGCDTTEGFRFAGEVWYVNGCRRRTCIHFRGIFFTETDACDTEIYNTTYKCIIEVDTNADYPHCCPRYRCNPDNLGNAV